MPAIIARRNNGQWRADQLRMPNKQSGRARERGAAVMVLAHLGDILAFLARAVGLPVHRAGNASGQRKTIILLPDTRTTRDAPQSEKALCWFISSENASFTAIKP